MNTPPTAWPPPVDLYGLGLLRLIATHGTITRAATAAGLTQSALTRQLQSMESRLSTQLFERTTRALRLTPAGETLLRETMPVTRIMDAALQNLSAKFLNPVQEVRVGISRSLALSHFPGILHAHLRRSSGVKTVIEHLPGTQLLTRLEAGDLDLAVLCPPARLPTSLMVTHRMEDRFHLIAPAARKPPSVSMKKQHWSAQLTSWLNSQPWLLINRAGQTGLRMRRWLKTHSIKPEIAMEPDDFDLIVHLVALGLGIGLVPRRALAGFPRKRQISRIALPEEFSRSLAVVVPKLGRTPTHVTGFISNILFS